MQTPPKTTTVLACAAIVVGSLMACKKSSSSSSAPAPTDPTPTTPTAPPKPAFDSSKIFKVGEQAKAPDYSMSIENVKECKVKYYFRAKKGNIKLGVEVQLEGSADKDVPVNPYYAKITDSDGYSYTSTFGGCEPELKAVRITKAEKARGWVTFEVPSKASGLKLSYSPIIIGSMKQEVKFDLGR